MKGRHLPQDVINGFAAHEKRVFDNLADWARHVEALTTRETAITPNPVLIANEAGLWGATNHQGLLQETVIVSDDAGQFRVDGARMFLWRAVDDEAYPFRKEITHAITSHIIWHKISGRP